MTELAETAEANEEAGSPETIPANNNNSWLDSLPDNLKGDEVLAKFKGVSELAQSYLETQKHLNLGGIPQDNAPAEEWEQYYNKAGRPQDKKYLEQRNAEDEEHLKAYEEMFYQRGLSKKQGEQILQDMYKYSDELQNRLQDTQKKEFEQIRNSNIEQLKNNYGSNYDSKLNIMQAALSKFGSKELADLIEENNYHPALIDLLVKFGETLQPDSLVTGSANIASNDPRAALKEIKRLESDKDFTVKLGDGSHPEHETAVNRMRELYKIAYDS